MNELRHLKDGNPTVREAINSGKIFICPGCGYISQVAEENRGIDQGEDVKRAEIACECGWSQEWLGDDVENRVSQDRTKGAL